MLRYPQVDKTIPLEDAAFLAQSFVNYFKGLEKIKDFYIRIQEDFLKSVNITKLIKNAPSLEPLGGG